jgi:hypothetical protein
MPPLAAGALGAPQSQRTDGVVGVATSVVVFAIGAILRFATTMHRTSFNIHTVGVILMVVGVLGFLASLISRASWGGFGGWRQNRTVYPQPTGTMVEERREPGFW